jgi:hypothetical protein
MKQFLCSWSAKPFAHYLEHTLSFQQSACLDKFLRDGTKLKCHKNERCGKFYTNAVLALVITHKAE